MSDDESSSQGSGSDAEGDDTPTEWNVNTRERRTTAGNRLSTLLQQEESKDDEVELLFEENEEEPDEDFDEDASVVGSDVAPDDAGGDSGSSSSSEDEGGADDELAGEKQLEKEERQAKRKQKRKADAAAVKPRSAKRVKIAVPEKDATIVSRRQSMPEPPRPRKKSERVSWALTDTASRTSSRTLSMQNKERTQASLAEAEAKRIKQMAVIEASQKRKAATKIAPMNQADRMAEAARTERANAKSLSRWEELEKDRVAKSKAKLEAMQNRVLDGPVIRWWSGRAEWVDGKCTQIGKTKLVEEVQHVPRKYVKKADKLKLEAAAVGRGSIGSEVPSGQVTPSATSGQSPAPSSTDGHSKAFVSETQPMLIDTSGRPSTMQPPTPSPTTAASDIAPQQSTSFLNGIEAYAAHPETDQQSITEPHIASAAPQPQSDPTQTQNELPQDVQGKFQPQQQPLPSPQAPQAPSNLTHPLDLIHGPPSTTLSTHLLPDTLPTAPLEPVKPQAPPTFSTRQTLTLLNYPAHITAPTPPSLDIRRRIFFGLPSDSVLKPTKPPLVLCAATGQVARYWDPRMGVGYRDLESGRRLRGLIGVEGASGVGSEQRGVGVKGRAIWSQALGAWISSGRGVGGVPEGFDAPVEGPVGAGSDARATTVGS